MGRLPQLPRSTRTDAPPFAKPQESDMDIEREIEQFLEWQLSPDGIVEGDITSLCRSVGDLWVSSLHGERGPLLRKHLPEIERQYTSLGRLLSRYKVRELA